MADVTSSATIVWKGNVARGEGHISGERGVFTDVPVDLPTRIGEETRGKTTPEELLAAAHAGCFSMALSKQLEDAGMRAEEINTTAAVTLEKTDAGFTITRVHLDVSARIPDADQSKFETATQNAKAGCPVSRLLNAEITMDARLEG